MHARESLGARAATRRASSYTDTKGAEIKPSAVLIGDRIAASSSMAGIFLGTGQNKGRAGGVSFEMSRGFTNTNR